MSYFAEQIWSPTSEAIMAWDMAFHDLMLNDQLRMNAYRNAIFSTVKPGDRVVDLGVGSGILSQWALEAGAASVIGIEMNEAMMAHAINRLEEAGLINRFIPVNKVSFDVELEVPADILISEIIGNIADNENFQPILSDAIKRLLKPNGSKIPETVTSFIVPVAAIKAHSDVFNGNVASLSPEYSVDKLAPFRSSQSLFDLYFDCVLPEQLYLSAPEVVRSFTGDWTQSPTYDRQISYTIQHEGSLTGFKAFFIAELAKDVVLDISGGDISAGQTSDSWKHAYLPIETPIDVRPGDVMNLAFSRFGLGPSPQSFRQVYQWQGTVQRDGVDVGEFSQRSR